MARQIWPPGYLPRMIGQTQQGLCLEIEFLKRSRQRGAASPRVVPDAVSAVELIRP